MLKSVRNNANIFDLMIEKNHKYVSNWYLLCIMFIKDLAKKVCKKMSYIRMYVPM